MQTIGHRGAVKGDEKQGTKEKDPGILSSHPEARGQVSGGEKSCPSEAWVTLVTVDGAEPFRANELPSARQGKLEAKPHGVCERVSELEPKKMAEAGWKGKSK